MALLAEMMTIYSATLGVLVVPPGAVCPFVYAVELIATRRPYFLTSAARANCPSQQPGGRVFFLFTFHFHSYSALSLVVSIVAGFELIAGTLIANTLALSWLLPKSAQGGGEADALGSPHAFALKLLEFIFVLCGRGS